MTRGGEKLFTSGPPLLMNGSKQDNCWNTFCTIVTFFFFLVSLRGRGPLLDMPSGESKGGGRPPKIGSTMCFFKSKFLSECLKI